jgi:16S rRNA (cytosine967-C5)-methyltransferase
VLRHQRELDTTLALDRADPRLHDVLRLGAYQLRWLTRVPSHAAVSTSVELARQTVGEGVTGYVNHALRKLSAIGYRQSGNGETHPDWLVARWKSRFGPGETARLTEWNDKRPELFLQPARWDQAALLRRLRESGVNADEAPFGAGIRLYPIANGQYPIARAIAKDLPGYHEGGFIVQDPAHALVARYAAIPQGELVYDACAAPGGKAVALETRGARVLAGDARHERLGRLADTARRAGVAIRAMAADLEAAPLRNGSAAAVLVDAPCSATGTLRRHPDARWRLRPATFARLAARERGLLAAAAALVRPGGLLIYATCSLEPEENEHVVEHLLTGHPEFRRSPCRDAVPPELLTADGDFQSLPQRHAIDGAYAARLVRDG